MGNREKGHHDQRMERIRRRRIRRRNRIIVLLIEILILLTLIVMIYGLNKNYSIELVQLICVSMSLV